MPIRGRTPQECFEQFKGHVSRLVAEVLDPSLHVTLVRGRDQSRRDLQLGPDGTNYVSLKKRSGGYVHFYLAQTLRAVEREDPRSEAERYQLTTEKYWYKVFDLQPGMQDEPLFRWEYSAEVPEGKQWCRHHFQIGKFAAGEAGKRKALEVPIGGGSIDLNRSHIPTGFTLMEFVFRFLFTELDVEHASDDWEETLLASEKKFFSEFSGKTSRS
jgi:hypothetical protein